MLRMRGWCIVSLYIVYHCQCCLWLQAEWREPSHWPETSSLQPPLQLTKVAGTGGDIPHYHMSHGNRGDKMRHWHLQNINSKVNNSEKSTCFRTLEIFPRVGGCFTLTGCLAWSALLSLATSFAFLPALITGAGQERVKSNFKLGETLNTQSMCWVGTTYYTVDTTRSLLLFKYLMSRNASFDRQELIDY